MFYFSRKQRGSRKKLDEKMSIRSWKKKVQGGIGFKIYFLGFKVFLSIFLDFKHFFDKLSRRNCV
jgi:hypothetical protein